MERIGTAQLVAKLQIWKNKHLPWNELIQQAIERLEEQADKIEILESRLEQVWKAENFD